MAKEMSFLGTDAGFGKQVVNFRFSLKNSRKA